MTIILYGIPNCDTVKKARVWLAARGVDYAFHDYKKAGADAAQIAHWVEQAGWEKVLNRAGTTFKKLPEAEKVDLDAAKAVAIMAANPSAIKRPIVERDGALIAVGFKDADWDALF
ncbi:MAG: arsenate reductase [Sphingomonadales bacterium]|nr:arsenate reductase [Sphingomonadales bacterium]MDE2168825.1 arsenate reductase [Sphingomonadales bacterium]